MAAVATDHQRMKSLLTEAVKILCKSILTYRSEVNIEGLIGITVDSSEVLLVSIHEAVTTDAVSSVETVDSSVEMLAGTTSVIFVTPDTGTGVSQFVEVGGLLRDDTKIVVEAAQLPETANATNSVVTVETAQIVADVMSTQAQPYPVLEAPQTSLFTTAELDEFIDNCPSVGIMNDSSCDVFAEVAITSESPPHSDKQLESNSDMVSKEPLTAGNVTDDAGPLLLPGDVEDTMPSCLSWDDDLSDIGPLNLAGPQDLSLQLDKKKYMCTVCGHLFHNEKEMTVHECKENPDAGDRLLTTMTEPLNLISRPLDLTKCRMDDEADDDPDSVYGMLMSATANIVAADKLSCVCGKTFEMSAMDTFTSHVSSCAKSKLIPYKSCETCGKTLFSNSGYIKHQRLHAGAYKYFCNICRRGFFDQTNLRAHADSRHSKVRRYACSLCSKSFYWKHHVKRHLKACGRGAKAIPTDDKDMDIETAGNEDGVND